MGIPVDNEVYGSETIVIHAVAEWVREGGKRPRYWLTRYGNLPHEQLRGCHLAADFKECVQEAQQEYSARYGKDKGGDNWQWPGVLRHDAI